MHKKNHVVIKKEMTLEEYNQEVAFVAILCGSMGIAEAFVLTKNKLNAPPKKGKK